MLTETIFSPIWWISVVFVGLLVSLSASYLKESLDNALAKVSAHRREKNAQRKQEFDQTVERLKSDRSEFAEYVLLTNDLSHRFLTASFAAIFIVGGVNLLLLSFGEETLDGIAKAAFLSGMALLSVCMVSAYSDIEKIGERRKVIDHVSRS
ncbi:hypothetical protein [Marinobacter confluentis]|uniref:DUF2721 domain-containing protein n=1 Tax=Marinobacter confluentis TaxID=1697557 RepID=A0A4Z1BPC8_9GAMM|nr:hypothetical protein [Marinobacter confluentis]TGN41827.1 hypothetical protein E5Q11_04715 [Marinobacter confluentis]